MQNKFQQNIHTNLYVVINIIIIITKCYCTRDCSSSVQKGKIQIFDEYFATYISVNCAYCAFYITHNNYTRLIAIVGYINIVLDFGLSDVIIEL